MDLEQRVDALEAEAHKCHRWQAEHDGRIDAWWEAQHTFNPRLEERVSKLEFRVIWFTGLCSGIGIIIGTVASAYIGG